MTEININNYETYLLDLAEGELSPADEKLLMLFLDKNPDIKAEHDLFELEKVFAEDIYFEDKSSLKKTGILDGVSSNNFDELCIARIEGDLKTKEIAEFDKLIKSSNEKKKEYNLFKLTQVKPDKNIIFKEKRSLNKKEGKTRILSKTYTAISIAASILIFISLYLFIPKDKENTGLVSGLEQNTKTEKKHEIVEKDNTENISNRKIAVNTQLNKEKIEAKELDNSPKKEITKRQVEQLAFIDPVEIEYDFTSKVGKESIIYYSSNKKQTKNREINESISFGTYLAANFNKRVLKKENKNKIELFDIAQVSLEKVNKLAGTKMSLERVYDENGIAGRTEFNSRLVAFSTPVKKDKKLL